MSKSTIFSVPQLLAMVAATVLSLNVMGAERAISSTSSVPHLSQSYVWYDGNREHKVWLNPDVVAEFNPSQQGATAARSADANAQLLPMKRRQGAVRLWKMNNAGGAAVRSLSTGNAVGKYSPVFHDGSTSNGAMRALPGNVIVYLNPTWDAAAVASWVKSRNLEVVKKLEIGPNIYVIKTAPGLEALNVANTLYLSGEVAAAFPDWWREVSTR
jgi:hypothetical protein